MIREDVSTVEDGDENREADKLFVAHPGLVGIAEVGQNMAKANRQEDVFSAFLDEWQKREQDHATAMDSKQGPGEAGGPACCLGDGQLLVPFSRRRRRILIVVKGKKEDVQHRSQVPTHVSRRSPADFETSQLGQV